MQSGPRIVSEKTFGACPIDSILRTVWRRFVPRSVPSEEHIQIHSARPSIHWRPLIRGSFLCYLSRQTVHSCRRTSGATYGGLPQTFDNNRVAPLCSKYAASPKSPTLRFPSPSRSTFSGLMSKHRYFSPSRETIPLWATPLLWQKCYTLLVSCHRQERTIAEISCIK